MVPINTGSTPDPAESTRRIVRMSTWNKQTSMCDSGQQTDDKEEYEAVSTALLRTVSHTCSIMRSKELVHLHVHVPAHTQVAINTMSSKSGHTRKARTTTHDRASVCLLKRRTTRIAYPTSSVYLSQSKPHRPGTIMSNS